MYDIEHDMPAKKGNLQMISFRSSELHFTSWKKKKVPNYIRLVHEAPYKSNTGPGL